MAYPDGIATTLTIEYEDGREQDLQLALGPSACFGNIHGVLERFCEAFTLSVGGYAFEMGSMRICLFDPERLLVSFDEDDQGRPDAEQAMSKRFAFVFIAMLEDQYDALDPWLVVTPCTAVEVRHWKALMALDERYSVRTWCLDEQLSKRTPG